MINIKDATLTQGGRTEGIIKFETYWVHPFKGMFEILGDAVKACEGSDFEPEEVLRPVTVAITNNFKEPLIR